jgi:hypothetical protein
MAMAVQADFFLAGKIVVDVGGENTESFDHITLTGRAGASIAGGRANIAWVHPSVANGLTPDWYAFRIVYHEFLHVWANYQHGQAMCEEMDSVGAGPRVYGNVTLSFC